jgi:hypothetical protein
MEGISAGITRLGVKAQHGLAPRCGPYRVPIRITASVGVVQMGAESQRPRGLGAASL